MLNPDPTISLFRHFVEFLRAGMQLLETKTDCAQTTRALKTRTDAIKRTSLLHWRECDEFFWGVIYARDLLQCIISRRFPSHHREQGPIRVTRAPEELAGLRVLRIL